MKDPARPKKTFLEAKWEQEAKANPPKVQIIKHTPNLWEYRYEDGSRVAFNPNDKVAVVVDGS